MKVEKQHIDNLVSQLEFKFARVENTTVTGCWAFLPNGFQVAYGESACVDPANYKWEDGCKYAKERCVQSAINKLWELEGYLLKVTGKTSVSSFSESKASSALQPEQPKAQDEGDDEVCEVLIVSVMDDFQCHKKVKAALISEIKKHGDKFSVVLSSPSEAALSLPYVLPSELLSRYEPKTGDYLVIYEGGYVSISPKDAFEGGYGPIDSSLAELDDHKYIK